jgi:preprotein translocase subunit SecY
MNGNFSSLLNSKDFKSRLFYLVIVLIIYRFGTFITLPGIDSEYVTEIFNNNFSSGIVGMFNLFSGGALGRMTIFALNVMPYIVSSIIVQIFISSLKNEGKISDDFNSKKINFYSKVCAIFLSFIQAFIVIAGLEKMGAFTASKQDFGYLLRYLSIFSLVCGTLFLVWLGDQITLKGVGNGISMIIFAGIVSELPSSISKLFILTKFSETYLIKIFLVIIILMILVLLIILFERSYRNIQVNYPRNHYSRDKFNKNSSHIPIKINVSGVIPPIFANALLLFPLTIANFAKGSVISDFIIKNFSVGQVPYFIFYISMICFFCFFYSDFVFNTKEISDSLKKNSGIIAGKRPGIITKQYLDFVLRRITVVGSIYLAFVCVMPEFLRLYFNLYFFLNGTSLLIIVNVIIELLSQVQIYIFNSQYSTLLKQKRFIINSSK